MREKKPVYNGYDEQYLTGAELKQLLKGHYYTTGRHHSVVLGIAIPDYLELIGIIDSREYRIFINDCFCRVMHSDTDRLICFFGHTDLIHHTQSNTFCDNSLEKRCSDEFQGRKIRRVFRLFQLSQLQTHSENFNHTPALNILR